MFFVVFFVLKFSHFFCFCLLIAFLQETSRTNLMKPTKIEQERTKQNETHNEKHCSARPLAENPKFAKVLLQVPFKVTCIFCKFFEKFLDSLGEVLGRFLESFGNVFESFFERFLDVFGEVFGEALARTTLNNIKDKSQKK